MDDEGYMIKDIRYRLLLQNSVEFLQFLSLGEQLTY